MPAVYLFLPLLARGRVGGRPVAPEPQSIQIRRPSRRVEQRPGAGNGLMVFSIIRNGLTNGYPFIEAYASWLDYADGVFVLDGESTDGTADALAALAKLDDRFTWASAPWPATNQSGEAIAGFTNKALSHARVQAGRLMYVQADEIYTNEQRRLVADWTDGALEFAGCINFWNSFDRVLANEFPMTYLRLLGATLDARSIGDGFSFEVGEERVHRIAEQILHYGWCFPENILRKHVSHALLYPDQPAYVARGRLAEMMLAQSRYDRRLLDALLPRYRTVSFEGVHPEFMRHLLGLRVYDPNVGLDLLAAGARW